MSEIKGQENSWRKTMKGTCSQTKRRRRKRQHLKFDKINWVRCCCRTFWSRENNSFAIIVNMVKIYYYELCRMFKRLPLLWHDVLCLSRNNPLFLRILDCFFSFRINAIQNVASTLIRNANSCATPQTYWAETLGMGLVLCLTRLPGFLMCTRLWETLILIT